MATHFNSQSRAPLTRAAIIRRMSMDTHMVRIYTGTLSKTLEYVSVEADKITTVDEVLRVAVTKLGLSNVSDYELAEVLNTAGQLCKERRLGDQENPVRVQLLWPRCTVSDHDPAESPHTGYRFYIRTRNLDIHRNSEWYECQDPRETFFEAIFPKAINKEYSDLCNLPDLNERTLLDNIKQRFQKQDTGIYTYVGSILIAVNPFQFFPIYNPKYVKMYQNKRLGDLPPHIFAIADAAFHTMLRTKRNQCIVISGESGSGKTESTNLLLHHLTALSHKGLHGSGVEQTILGAGPVLEAFGNAKTVHNNNSSRFGKFIQVNYKENGMVHGAIVEKYLLEKSRIVSQAPHERNYHVFYYLLAGADDLEREKLHVGVPEAYFYLNQSDCFTIEDVDEAEEFSRLKQSMEIVGFSQVTQKRIFGVLSAVLHLGNVKFKKKGDQHHDESVTITNQETIKIISQLLKVKEKTLVEALTLKRATAGDETVVMTHRMEDALATRDAMAKCLYGALFDWIVLKVNQALLAKRHNSEHQGNSIGVLDIFGFEDFSKNSFEQFCINYANEHLQYYFNQHIFKFEQEEYEKEGIQWKNIEFIDNTGCLDLFSKRGKGLFSLLDEECNFPGATNETLLSKFHHHHKANVYYEVPQKREMAFAVVHYAGKVKYQIKDFREKNSDQIRTDIVANLKSSSLAFVRELMGVDPVAVLRWTILKTLVKSMFAFIKAGQTYRARGGPDPAMVQRRKQSSECYLTIPDLSGSHILRKNKSFKPRSRPQTMFSDIKTLKAIANRTMYTGGKVSTKQKPPSVSAQFQWSLSRLMATLDAANPFFIRCIKSNANKDACTFDDVLVLRQLRYTGMLATVRIRQSGYNYRLTFEEFAQLYKILLPKGLQSEKEDVQEFLEHTPMNKDNYQIGITKVFLRETEKLYLDECLHRAIMKRVVAIQRWVKTKVERKNFLMLKENTIFIQKFVRTYLARRRLNLIRESVLMIQKWYRMARVYREYRRVREGTICIQAVIRGHLQRKQYRLLKLEHARQLAEQEALKHSDDMSTSDEGVPRDSADELEVHKIHRRDSEESSGILDDSESDTLSEAKSRGDSMSTPPPTPTHGVPGITVQGLAGAKDPFISQLAKQSSRVSNLVKVYQPPQDGSNDVDGRMPIESPSPTERGQHLTPERVKLIEDQLKKSRSALQPKDNLQGSEDDLHRSPFKRAVNFITTGGRRKKDSAADDSDDEMESGKEHTKRPNVIGIQVLPNQPMSPKSPKEETASLTSFEEQDEKRGIKKKRLTKKPDKDRDRENKENNFSVAKASQWQYPDEFMISETYELQLLDEFIGRKIVSLTKDSEKKESLFDTILTKCLKSFHMELKTTLSVALQKGNTCNIKYRDLFANFEVTMNDTCEKEQVTSEFPVTMCINAFRGFLDEFRNIVNTKKKDKHKKKQRPKNREKAKKDMIEHQGHKFSQVQFGIPTFCELCSSIIWLMEKGHVCQICKYTCHRKCISKSTAPCKGSDASDQRISGTKVFGVPLRSLVGKDEKMPAFMENLITLIETHGLFTEGIYRKSGGAHKIKMLKMVLDSGVKDVSVDEYAIHVLTSALKSFFRELPEPLLTFEFYDEFMQASEIKDEKEAIQVLFSITERLPKINHDVFERLIFHLARVAHHEKSNKMSVNGLAIIFAPCLLRTNKVIKAQEMILHVTKQQICIEKILAEQLQKLQTTLEDIKTLESAEVTANERLTVVRASMRNPKSPVPVSKKPQPQPSVSEDPETLAEQERVISSHIESLRKEKDELTSGLPNFEYRHSSDDEMLSVDEMESIYDTADEEYGREESGSTFDVPVKPPSQLFHPTKHRADGPERRLPSRHTFSNDRLTRASTDLDIAENADIPSSHHSYQRSTFISDITISSHHTASHMEVVKETEHIKSVKSEIRETVQHVKKDKHKQEVGKSEQKDNETGKRFRFFALAKADPLFGGGSHKHIELTKPRTLPGLAQVGSKVESKDLRKTKVKGAFSPKMRSKLTRSQPVNVQTVPDSVKEQKGLSFQASDRGEPRNVLVRQLSDSSLHSPSMNAPATTTESQLLSSAIIGSPPRYSGRLFFMPRSVEVARISSYENAELSLVDSGTDDDDEIMV